MISEECWKVPCILSSVILTPGNAVEPSRSIRRVTVFRDDFNRFDHSHYKIEVDATGGGVCF